MSNQVQCDGCGVRLSPRTGGHDEADDYPIRRIHGERTDGSSVRDLPEPGGEFDWCGRCAIVAFAALRDANAGRDR